MRRRTGLTALFWRYLLVTGGAVVLLAVLWWGGLSALLRSGFVLPAGTAAGQADGLVRALEAGELTPAELPHYYRWAAFDGSAQVVGQRGMGERHLGYARAALGGDRTLHGFPYQQYHRSAQLPDGTVCLLQFDYSMPYGSPALQGRLPEFQTCATAVLLAAWLAAGALSTRHFAGLLRRDAALLTAATGAIAARRLDLPLDGGARVRELGESLAAMEQLRKALARALSEQWAMEQERTQALAALAHDLKTPLSIVSGSAELLEEDALSPAQRERVDAILRSASRIRDYMEQLRALTAAGGPAEAGGRATAELSALAEGWAPPEGCAFLWTAPPPAPVPCSGRSWTGRCSTCWTTPPASPRRGARCACRRMWRRPYSPWPWRTPAPASPPRPWPGRGGAFTPATLAGPGRATWAWVSPSPTRPPAATAGRWSCPTPAGGPGRPSPCPSEEGGAVFRAAFLYFCPFRAIIEGEPIPTL